MRSILFVCTANICRSPMAEGVFTALVKRAGRQADFLIDSAGTHDYHVGKPPFAMSRECAARRGYAISHLVARRVSPQDFERFDALLAMDRSNVASLCTIAPTRYKNKIELLLDYGDEHYGKDVPDPYGRALKDFELALDMIEDGCRGLASFLTRSAAVR
jgi:protein-tyrosine phosphatase